MTLQGVDMRREDMVRMMAARVREGRHRLGSFLLLRYAPKPYGLSVIVFSSWH